MTYALRVYLAHTGSGFAACAPLFETLAGRDHDLRVGRHEGLEAPVAEVESWREDFEVASSMRATARLNGFSVSMSIELVPVPNILVSIPTDDEQAGIATASSLASSLDVDFGVLQAVASAPPTVLATDEDRLAYLALASTNLGGERFESTGPVATGALTFVSSRLVSASRGSLQLQDVQGLTMPNIAALCQATAIMTPGRH